MFKEFIRPLILLLSICQIYTANAFQINTTDSSLYAHQAVEKAILNASKHDQKQANFSAEIFIQNTGKWNRIPSIWKGLLKKEGIEGKLAYQSESYGKFRVDTAYNYVFDFKVARNNYHAEARADKFVNPNFYKANVDQKLFLLSRLRLFTIMILSG
jgi:hypothetical protein